MLNFLVLRKQCLEDKKFHVTSVSFCQLLLFLCKTLPEGLRKVLVLFENGNELDSRRKRLLLHFGEKRKSIMCNPYILFNK